MVQSSKQSGGQTLYRGKKRKVSPFQWLGMTDHSSFEKKPADFRALTLHSVLINDTTGQKHSFCLVDPD
jgi:hypothetical protein